MNTLPSDWAEMSRSEQEDWFAKYWIDYIADGETAGLRSDAPEEIARAYEVFLKQK